MKRRFHLCFMDRLPLHGVLSDYAPNFHEIWKVVIFASSRKLSECLCGAELFARSGVRMITVDSALVRAAEKLIESCQHCNPEDAVIAFDVVLDQVTGSDPSVTDYILESLAKCPNC